MSTDVTVTRDPDHRRYHASAGGTGVAGFVEYQESSDLVVLTHTEVDPSFEGRGSAARWHEARSTTSAPAE